MSEDYPKGVMFTGEGKTLNSFSGMCKGGTKEYTVMSLTRKRIKLFLSSLCNNDEA